MGMMWYHIRVCAMEYRPWRTAIIIGVLGRLLGFVLIARVFGWGPSLFMMGVSGGMEISLQMSRARGLQGLPTLPISARHRAMAEGLVFWGAVLIVVAVVAMPIWVLRALFHPERQTVGLFSLLPGLGSTLGMSLAVLAGAVAGGFQMCRGYEQPLRRNIDEVALVVAVGLVFSQVSDEWIGLVSVGVLALVLVAGRRSLPRRRVRVTSRPGLSSGQYFNRDLLRGQLIALGWTLVVLAGGLLLAHMSMLWKTGRGLSLRHAISFSYIAPSIILGLSYLFPMGISCIRPGGVQKFARAVVLLPVSRAVMLRGFTVQLTAIHLLASGLTVIQLIVAGRGGADVALPLTIAVLLVFSVSVPVQIWPRYILSGAKGLWQPIFLFVTFALYAILGMHGVVATLP